MESAPGVRGLAAVVEVGQRPLAGPVAGQL